MRPIFLFLALSLVALAGCGHFTHYRDCDPSCCPASPATSCTPAPTAPVPSISVPAPTVQRIEVQAPPAVQVTCPAPRVEFVTPPVAPVSQLAGPAFVAQQPLFGERQPYLSSIGAPQTIGYVQQPASNSLALLLDWIPVSLPMPRLASVPGAPSYAPVLGMPQPQMMPAYYQQPQLMQPQFQQVYQNAPQPVPQALILSVAPQPPPLPAPQPLVAQPNAAAQNAELCKQLEALKAAIEAQQRAAGCK